MEDFRLGRLGEERSDASDRADAGELEREGATGRRSTVRGVRGGFGNA